LLYRLSFCIVNTNRKFNFSEAIHLYLSKRRHFSEDIDKFRQIHVCT
jgi:hypothetical protein